MLAADPSIAKHLKVLGISAHASMSEVKQAHRDLASVWHPDRFPGNPRLQDIATEKLKDINVAFEALVKHYETYGGFSVILGDGEEPGECVREEVPEEAAAEMETPGGDDAPAAESAGWPRLADHAVSLSILAALCLVGLIYLVLAHKKLDVRGLPVISTPYQATVVESEPQAADRVAKASPSGKVPSQKAGVGQGGAQADRNKYFTLGSSKDEVRAAEGAPQQLTENRWTYGSSYVDFAKGQVTGWLSSSLNRLNVRIAPSRETGAGPFTQGSSQDRVAAVQGTPTQVAKDRWSYGFSYVDFEKGRVKSWYSSSMDPLNVVMTPSREPENDYFTVGSSKDEVLAIQGTPTQLTESRWGYGYSYVDFENGRVVKWYNSERDPLKVQGEDRE